MRSSDILESEYDDWLALISETDDQTVMDVSGAWCNALMSALNGGHASIEQQLADMNKRRKDRTVSHLYHDAYSFALQWILMEWDRMPVEKPGNRHPDDEIPF